ncbi:MAG: PD40 domain-containing protein [Bdellovibrionales bacterium]|nr:PD40 domain-containing protein [Bdellovibrionales bacterium]
MLRIKTIAFLLIAALQAALPESARAEAAYIPIGKAKVRKTVIAMPESQAVGEGESFAEKVIQTAQNDLAFMDLFSFLPESAFPDEPAALPAWSSNGAEFLLKSSISTDAKSKAMTLEAHLFDAAKAQELLNKRYVAGAGDAVTVGHTLANDIVQRLTGLPGIFLTKIAMSCDGSRKKEIYAMNYDGTDVKRITHHHSIALAPAWSPDGTRLAYSLYTRHRNNVKNIDLFEFDFTSNTIRLLSNRTGINSGAVYSPDGKHIALTMSFLGNPEIFLLDRKTRNATRLTRSFGFDVDPAFSPDGKQVAFVSSRTGRPMVFSMSRGGTNVQRLTYAGQYNATPTWSPQNNKMAFAGWLDKGFDIFIMNPNGTNIERLTKDEGSNEDPSFSPDGQFIAFSSNRAGTKNIYVMNIDGTFVKRLTYGLGNCVAPRWSNANQ